MSLNDPISNALNNINNAENVAKKICTLNHSKLVENILTVLKNENYIGNYKVIDKAPHKKVVVYLDGRINKCKAIKPRFAVKHDEYEKFEKSFLISRDVGIFIVSTTSGLMTHKNAKQKGLGGRLIAYVY
ncbi:MAG: 30S ribosomal protein S8 [Candidatus ainarchaeum sp.]|jgi:small subunit ribosomal protein S8|nr:30S ribosomal protein S8 [Candidatus ainarchaeum sp.]NCP72399.1 30S ribosomal protein S8 [archaeon]NCP79574.1 30S ribosomal protein S8 [archaeon]NCP98355.1 30S ribosomal protein S8 [archaeon]NCQ07341.1 30S ribosomal protein S8 [archaeon]